MSRLLNTRSAVLALLLGLVLVATPLVAQNPEMPPDQPPTEPAAPAATEGDDLDFLEEGESTPEDSNNDLTVIENLLEEGEASIDTGFVFDPGGRRDPFRSLLRVADTVQRQTGPRPEGVPGLLISELVVTGVWMFPEGPVAQVQSSDEPISYLLRPGTRVFDGEVTSISFARGEGGTVVFRQIVTDPTSPKPFREVVRRVEQ